jgi:acyl-coenzyme A thioesterase PaaI-like protein
MEGGESELLYLPKPEHLNSFLVTHGGAIMTLLDVTMADGRAQRRSGDRRGHHRDEDHLHAALRSACCTGKGRLMHRTASRWPSPKARSTTSGARACAHATGTFKYVKRRLPTRPRERERDATD